MDEVIGLGRVSIDERRIAEIVDGTALVSVPRSEVRKLRLRFGPVTERPWLMHGFGLLALLVGACGIILLIDGRFPKTGALSSTLLLAAPLLIHSALRHGPYLEVATGRSVRKLGFGDPQPSPDALRAFVAAAREARCEIETDR